MGKDPAFLFYSSDFLSGVSDLTMKERGQFITLLCLQHQKGGLTQKAIDITVPNVSEDVLIRFKKRDDGLFYNDRLELERDKRLKHSEKQRQRALDGWKKRKKKKSGGKATADATALPLENVNENDNTSIKKEPEKIQFAEFVFMTQKQCDLLTEKYGKGPVKWMVNKLSNYKGANGKQYKDDYRAILSWVVEEYNTKSGKPTLGEQPLKYDGKFTSNKQ